MSLFSALEVAASGMAAQRTRVELLIHVERLAPPLRPAGPLGSQLCPDAHGTVGARPQLQPVVRRDAAADWKLDRRVLTIAHSAGERIAPLDGGCPIL